MPGIDSKKTEFFQLLGYEPTVQELEFHTSLDLGVFDSTPDRGAGKTTALIIEAGYVCWLYPASHVLFWTQSYAQAGWTFGAALGWLKPLTDKVHASNRRLELENGSRLEVFGGEGAERLRGMKLSAVFIDWRNPFGLLQEVIRNAPQLMVGP